MPKVTSDELDELDGKATAPENHHSVWGHPRDNQDNYVDETNTPD